MWSFQTGKGIFSSPVVGADGTIYFGSADKNFYAVSPSGTQVWQIACGELIDSAALLDDKGRLYFGSGDAKLRALNAKTGAVVWTMTADDPTVNSAYINWFEGNVGIGLDGDLYVPNDNYFIYAVDRATGAPKWKFKVPDQTWSLPAIDTANGGTLYVGNNNMVPLLGPNTFSISADGGQNWSDSIAGTIAASPMLTADGQIVLGAFDGYEYAYDHNGTQLWKFAARDHIYASAALLPDGTFVAASADGSVYDLDPKTGTANWQFDTPAPIRSSPSIDADGNVYFGCGDGRLYVLGPDGKLRWSVLLIDADRNDLNASPALGADAIYIGGESGEVFSVPYEYCLRADAGGDSRCSTTPPAFPSGASLLWTTTFGSLQASPPTTIDPTTPITLTLVDRTTSGATLAIMDSSSVAVTLDPPTPVTTVVSGDGKFVTIVPQSPFAAGPAGTVSISVSAPYLVNMTRTEARPLGRNVRQDGADLVRADRESRRDDVAVARVGLDAHAPRRPAPDRDAELQSDRLRFALVRHQPRRVERELGGGLDGRGAGGRSGGRRGRPGVEDDPSAERRDRRRDAHAHLARRDHGAGHRDRSPVLFVPYGLPGGRAGAERDRACVALRRDDLLERSDIRGVSQGPRAVQPADRRHLVRRGRERREPGSAVGAGGGRDGGVLGRERRGDGDAHGLVAAARSAPRVDLARRSDDGVARDARVRARQRAHGGGRRDDRDGPDSVQRSNASRERARVSDDRYGGGGERDAGVAVAS